MRYYLIISNDVGVLNVKPSRIGVTDDLDHLESAFKRMAFAHRDRFLDFQSRPSPLAAFVTTSPSIDWLEGKMNASTEVDQTAGRMIDRLDADERFSRAKRLDSMLDGSLQMSREQADETIERIRQM